MEAVGRDADGFDRPARTHPRHARPQGRITLRPRGSQRRNPLPHGRGSD